VTAPGQEEREKRGFQKSLKVRGNYKRFTSNPKKDRKIFKKLTKGFLNPCSDEGFRGRGEG